MLESLHTDRECARGRLQSKRPNDWTCQIRKSSLWLCARARLFLNHFTQQHVLLLSMSRESCRSECYEEKLLKDFYLVFFHTFRSASAAHKPKPSRLSFRRRLRRLSGRQCWMAVKVHHESEFHVGFESSSRSWASNLSLSIYILSFPHSSRWLPAPSRFSRQPQRGEIMLVDRRK